MAIDRLSLSTRIRWPILSAALRTARCYRDDGGVCTDVASMRHLQAWSSIIPPYEILPRTRTEMTSTSASKPAGGMAKQSHGQTGTSKLKASRDAWTFVCDAFRGLFRLSEWETKKAVAHNDSTHLLFKCAVHVIPVATSVVIATINLRGLFIGYILDGLTTAGAQSVDRLCIQVAAKLFVRPPCMRV